ncbi:MAG: hypothetical protein JNG84_07060, partial [Archangium sp.]|nr:hypothetical protein [Archangium sp.]
AGAVAGTFTDTVVVEANQLTAFASVQVVPGAVALVRVTPDSVVLPVDGTQVFSAEARDAFDNVVATPVVWATDPLAGTIDDAGVFIGAATPGDFPDAVTATVNSVVGSAAVSLVDEEVDGGSEEPLDAGAPPEVDAGASDVDAGEPEVDAGEPSDAGEVPVDVPDAGEDGSLPDGGMRADGELDTPVVGCGCSSVEALPAFAMLLLAARRRRT